MFLTPTFSLDSNSDSDLEYDSSLTLNSDLEYDRSLTLNSDLEYDRSLTLNSDLEYDRSHTLNSDLEYDRSLTIDSDLGPILDVDLALDVELGSTLNSVSRSNYPEECIRARILISKTHEMSSQSISVGNNLVPASDPIFGPIFNSNPRSVLNLVFPWTLCYQYQYTIPSLLKN
ncbi:hypothetical protein EVAR_44797_1 [Eumeta japonica]|uniref:Uncharacterized protein n=1 Tax=Eumeta variegata TaxID=151549 RepID=A0A4C1X9L4_EUMVA|nr:hypothetical protein EVAR_44797_1 [Eumeta japonica]